MGSNQIEDAVADITLKSGVFFPLLKDGARQDIGVRCFRFNLPNPYGRRIGELALNLQDKGPLIGSKWTVSHVAEGFEILRMSEDNPFTALHKFCYVAGANADLIEDAVSQYRRNRKIAELSGP